MDRKELVSALDAGMCESIKSSLNSITQSDGTAISPSKKACFLNLSNHPSQYWSQEQLEAASIYGEIIDMPFPKINPELSETDIRAMSEEYVNQILELERQYHVTVHVMGEMTFTYMVVSELKSIGIECIASTTKRVAEDLLDGTKISTFQFVRFRRY